MIVTQTQQEKILEKIIVIVPILMPPKEDPEISVIATTKVAELVSKRFLTYIWMLSDFYKAYLSKFCLI